MIKVAMCDDLLYLCEYFQSFLDIEEDINFVGMAHNKADSISMIEKQKPDILLLDIQMDTMETGLELIPIIKNISPQTKIIVLTIHDDNSFILRAFSLGANDYMSKDSSKSDVLSIIRNVHISTCMLRPSIAQKILNEYDHIVKENEMVKQERQYLLNQSNQVKQRQDSILLVLNIMTMLSTTEYEILRMLCNGNTYKDISTKRFISESTVRTHISRILKKFGNVKTKELIQELKDLNVFEMFE